MPLSSNGPNKWPSAATQTISGLVGLITIRIICLELSSPIWFQFLPPSSLRHMPCPSLTLLRRVVSPSPTYKTEELDGATATLPIEPPKNLSEMFFQLLPPSCVFQTPPPVAPK